MAATVTAALLLVVLLLGLSSGQSLNLAGLQAESVLARWFEPASLALHVLGVPYAPVLAAAAAFLAAFLNAAFGFCLGCELYLFIRRLRRVTPAPAR